MDFMKNFGHLVTEDTIDILSSSIARRLAPHRSTPVEMEELCNWARLGIATAMRKFDQSEMDKVDVAKPLNWLCGYLANKGYYEALDEMRSAHVVGRFRNGKFYGAPLPTQPFSEVEDSTGDSSVIEDGDEGRGEACRTVDLAELVTTISGSLAGHEKEIFDGRYKHGLSLQDIARSIGVTAQRVYQIHTTLIVRIREYMVRGGVFADHLPGGVFFAA